MSEETKAGASVTDQEALIFHQKGRPGKLEIVATKPMATQRDLSLAYSPGVAAPVRAIADDPSKAFDYTARGNVVAVITNGSAILGLGNLGALASKPVMEGKAVLFKRFADVDSIDIEVDTQDPKEFIQSVRYLGPSFGGINLEDIKAPECFIIERELKKIMDIPVFHDDQHGTAIISTAGLINALHLTGREAKDIRVVCNGAGAAGIACIELMKAMGVPHENVILCDTKGPIYKGRNQGMNEWKEKHAVHTEARTLDEALKGADVFFGVSAKGALTPEMVKNMAPQPIIFAMANPDPEITPEEARTARPDAIIATGRSDYPNQVNNVLGFPYIFRGALDVRATEINDTMKMAAAKALAMLAREDVPDEVLAAYKGGRPKFGPDYIIPVPFDPRLLSTIPTAVAKAAMDSGVARKPIEDFAEYENQLSARRDPLASILQRVYDKVRSNPKRVVFAEGEEERVIRAATAFANEELGTAILVGREDIIRQGAEKHGLDIDRPGIEIVSAKTCPRLEAYTEHLYGRLQRKGFLYTDCQRKILNRNFFSASMVALGDADAMISGVTQGYSIVLEEVQKVIDPHPARRVVGITVAISKEGPVLISDTALHETPNKEELADIAEESVGVARKFGLDPRVAMLSFSTFGYPDLTQSKLMNEAVKILDNRGVDFEYDGEMAADVALNKSLMEAYPFCRLSGPANVLVMPSFHSASIASKMLQELGGSTLLGPLLVGLSKPVQVLPMTAKDVDIVNMAALAAYDLGA